MDPEPSYREDLRAGVPTAFAAYVLWGLLTIYWKLLKGFDAFQLIGVRICAASAVLVVALAMTGRLRALARVLHRPRLLARLALASVLLCANWSSYMWAVLHGRVVETALGYFMSPLVTVLLGVTVLHEEVRRAQRLALGLAFVAIVILTVSYGRIPIVAVVIAGTWGSYGLLKRNVPLAPAESLAAETLMLLVPAFVVVAVGFGGAGGLGSQTTSNVLLASFSGIATVVPLVLFAAAAHRVPLTVLGPMQFAVPVINFTLGVLVYHEALPVSRLTGFGLVWVGLVVSTVDTIRVGRARRAPALVSTAAL